MKDVDIFEELSLLVDFPNLRTSTFCKTSEATSEYNCVAWAAGETDRWWWPDSTRKKFWPRKARREVTMEAFVEAFQSLGYEQCESSILAACRTLREMF